MRPLDVILLPEALSLSEPRPESTGKSQEERRKVILWVSRHRPLPCQLRELHRLFGSVALVLDPNPFSSAEDIMRRAQEWKADEAVVVAPLSVIQRLTELGLRPLWGEMGQIPLKGPLNPDCETEVKGRRYRFVRFRRVKAVRIEFEELEP